MFLMNQTNINVLLLVIQICKKINSIKDFQRVNLNFLLTELFIEKKIQV